MFGYIYKITNTINGKVYIGKHKHSKSELDENYLTSGVVIKNAIKKYGISKFTNEIIDIADTLEDLNKKEIFYINEFDSFHSGYNLTLGGDGISQPSPEILEINRKKHLGKVQSQYTKNKRNQKLKQIVHTKEWIEKISKANKGQIISEQTKLASIVRHKGTHWYNDGTFSYMLFENDPKILSEGLVKG